MDFVQLARPTKSLSMFLQMVGRVTRPNVPVDQYSTVSSRQLAIKQSSKPTGIVLDNAGLWQDHSLPDVEVNWEKHFAGTKGKKEAIQGEFEMLVFVAEKADGTFVRTADIKEIEGLKLTKVTSELRRKIINLTSLKYFDQMYHTFQRMPKIKKPGYVALDHFKDYCKKNNYLMVPEVWDYLEMVLVTRVKDKIALIEKNYVKTGPLELFANTQKDDAIKALKDLGVSSGFLKVERAKYEMDNLNELAVHRRRQVENFI
jgi:hypothetical protein